MPKLAVAVGGRVAAGVPAEAAGFDPGEFGVPLGCPGGAVGGVPWPGWLEPPSPEPEPPLATEGFSPEPPDEGGVVDAVPGDVLLPGGPELPLMG